MNHGLPPALQLLARVKDPLADEALVTAAPHLPGDVLAAVVSLLIERGHTPALVHLLRSCRSAPALLNPLLLPRLNELHPAIAALLFEGDVDDRLGAAALIEAARDTAGADLLADALRHSCVRTRQAAAEALAAMTDHLLKQPCCTQAQVTDFQQNALRLTSAVHSALQAWRQHHQAGVLQAALRLMPMMTELIAQAAARTGTPLAHALQKAMEDASEPEIAETAVRCLAIPELRAAAAQAIVRASDSAFIRGILRSGWLVADPQVRNGCLLIRKGKWEAQWLQALAELTESEIAAGVDFISATGGSAEGKVEGLRHLLASSTGSPRRAAFWQAIQNSHEAPARQLLESIAVRDDEELAAIAKLECVRKSGSWASLDEGADQMCGTSTDVADNVRGGLSDPNPLQRVRSLAALENMHAAARFKEDVLRLLRDQSPAVRSAAVALIPKLAVTNPAYLIRQSLGDADPRVQANAVEVADALHMADLLAIIVPLMNANDARLRANAVKFCAQEGVHQAGEVLIAMLESPLAAHRRSALWVADRLHLLSLKPRIESLATSEPDEAVKRYAIEIGRRISRSTPAIGQRSPAGAR